MTANPTDDPLIGQRIGDFAIERELGRGGMGAVYQLRSAATGRLAAVKVLHPEIGQNQAITRRFFNEARAANHIHHPSIIEIGESNYLPTGQPYLVMEFLDGDPLDVRMAQSGGPMEPAEVVALLSPVCDGLAAAHHAGIVHRDIKPENLFVLRQPVAGTGVKIVDFGIAKLGTELAQGDPTRTGALLGTPVYMAPEQALGKVSEIDGRTDVYSLGAVAYEMLTGSPPFGGANLAALLSAQINEVPVLPSARRPALGAAWDAFLMKALAKAPAARHPDMAEFKRAMARAHAGTDASASALQATMAAPQAAPAPAAPTSRSPQPASPATAPAVGPLALATGLLMIAATAVAVYVILS